jgi:hypothetical protein
MPDLNLFIPASHSGLLVLKNPLLLLDGLGEQCDQVIIPQGHVILIMFGQKALVLITYSREQFFYILSDKSHFP